MITEKTFKSLANKDRIEMIFLISKSGKMTATEIQRNFYMEQPTCWHHLNYLKSQGIVMTEKVGRNTYYSVNTNKLNRIKLFFDTLNTLRVPKES